MQIRTWNPRFGRVIPALMLALGVGIASVVIAEEEPTTPGKAEMGRMVATEKMGMMVTIYLFITPTVWTSESFE